MSILVDENTPIIIQGITGTQGRVDTRLCLEYGTRIVAGVTPGRGGSEVEGLPVFDTVAEAITATGATASVQYVPAKAAAGAAMEAIECGLSPIVAIAENLPRHDAARAAHAARSADLVLIGFNTNGVISAGKTKLGGIGGARAHEIFPPGRVGICSRSGGMAAEIGATLGAAGFGVSTCVAMGAEPITGQTMAEYVRLFEADKETDAIIVFGEPGTDNEGGLARAISNEEITKPVIAMIVGDFQDAYRPGTSFGHFAAMAKQDAERSAVKRNMLKEAGALIALHIEDIPKQLALVLQEPNP